MMIRICRSGRGCLRQTQNMPACAGMSATNSEYAGLGGDACDKLRICRPAWGGLRQTATVRPEIIAAGLGQLPSAGSCVDNQA